MADRYFWDMQALEGETKILWFELESQAATNPLLIRAGRGISLSERTSDGVYKLTFEDDYYPLGKNTSIKFLPILTPQDPADVQETSARPLSDGVQITRGIGDFDSGRKVSLMVVVRNSNADQSGA